MSAFFPTDRNRTASHDVPPEDKTTHAFNVQQLYSLWSSQSIHTHTRNTMCRLTLMRTICCIYSKKIKMNVFPNSKRNSFFLSLSEQEEQQSDWNVRKVWISSEVMMSWLNVTDSLNTFEKKTKKKKQPRETSAAPPQHLLFLNRMWMFKCFRHLYQHT